MGVATRVLMLLENCGYPRDDRVRREARALTEAGYRVTVICPRCSGQLCRESLGGVQVYRFAAPPAGQGVLGYLWEYGYSLAAMFVLSVYIFVTDGFDIVHAHHPPDALAFIGVFFKLFGKRYILDHHDLAPELYYARFGSTGNRRVYRLLVGLEKLACRLADHVIATNQSYKAIEMERGSVQEQRITIVRNGPDLDELRPAAPDQGLRLSGKTIIGYVGVMGFQDGVKHLLRAVGHLVRDLGRTDLLCELVGSGAAMPSLRSLTEELHLAGYVRFIGWVEFTEVARHLCAADICVAPEPSDPYNDRSTAAKVMEYMAMGKPTVAFDLPEHRATARSAAAYARPNDEMDLARQIAALMDDPERCMRMGRCGRERVRRELAWSHQRKHLLEAYATVCERCETSGEPRRQTEKRVERAPGPEPGAVVRRSGRPGAGGPG